MKKTIEYEKVFSMDSISLEERNIEDEIINKYVLDKGCLYKIELVEKYTLIHTMVHNSRITRPIPPPNDISIC